MVTMRCPSCGDPVELAQTGVTFKHVFHANGQSSMFHDEALVHECELEAVRSFEAQQQEVASRDAWVLLL